MAPLVRLLRLVIPVILFAASSARADCAKDPECDAPGPWMNFTAVTLNASQPGARYTANYRLRFDPQTYDTLVSVDEGEPRSRRIGMIGMVGGRVMLTKGLTLEAGREIDALDAPVLNMRLVMILLGRALPAGPDAVRSVKAIDMRGKEGIKFATPSASGYIPAGWHAKGEVRRLASGAIAYDILLQAPMSPAGKAGSDYKLRLAGDLAMRTGSVFEDGMALEGWTVYGVGPQEQHTSSGTILDYGAKPQRDSPFKTVADIRSFIAAERDPGKLDATKDFTGFWKSDCKDAFGTQIKRYGDDGRYSLVFCGPGGCGDPAEGRLTFITGDKHFEIISEDEILEVYGGKKDRMIRCTRETNPVLKY